jgi:hypothetical protein
MAGERPAPERLRSAYSEIHAMYEQVFSEGREFADHLDTSLKKSAEIVDGLGLIPTVQVVNPSSLIEERKLLHVHGYRPEDVLLFVDPRGKLHHMRQVMIQGAYVLSPIEPDSARMSTGNKTDEGLLALLITEITVRDAISENTPQTPQI